MKNASEMEVKQENIIAAYETTTESGKLLLQALFPDLSLGQIQEYTDNRPITERIKTFEDACTVLGDDHPCVQIFQEIYGKSKKDDVNVNKDVAAFLKLRIITAALNEGWMPNWDNRGEYKWYPWFYILTKGNCNNLNKEESCRVVSRSYHSVDSYSHTYFGARLALKSKDLAKYCAEQFSELWAMFLVDWDITET